MAGIIYQGKVAKSEIPLTTVPKHSNVPNAIGCAKRYRAGDVIDGHDKYSYSLNASDELIVIAQHQQDSVQIILKSRDPNIINKLPGTKANSLVKNTLAILHGYLTRQDAYCEQRTNIQQQKRRIAIGAIEQLQSLLGRERSLEAGDLDGQEYLRNDVIKILEFARDKNRQLSDSITIAEGELNRCLYHAAHEYASEYHFNQFTQVSRQDQLDFSYLDDNEETIENQRLAKILLEEFDLQLSRETIIKLNQYFSTTAPCPKFNKNALQHLFSQLKDDRSQLSAVRILFIVAVIEQCYDDIKRAHHQQTLPLQEKTIVWDSQYHIGSDQSAFDDAIRIICQQYNLGLPKALQATESHRFKRMHRFFTQFWQQCQAAVDYYATDNKPHDTIEKEHRDHLNITTVEPDYRFCGIRQQAYPDILHLASARLGIEIASLEQIPSDDECRIEQVPNITAGQFIKLSEGDCFLLCGMNHDNTIIRQYYYHDHSNACIPLPDGEDVYAVTQASKRHIFWPDRLNLKARSFITNIIPMCRLGYQKIKHFVIDTIPEHFTKQMHQGHIIDPHLRTFLSSRLPISRAQADRINQSIDAFNQYAYYHHWLISEFDDPQDIRQDMFDKLEQACGDVGLDINNFRQDLLHQDGPLQAVLNAQFALIEEDRRQLTKAKEQQQTISQLLINQGYLKEGEKLSDLIERIIAQEQIVFAQAEHPSEDTHFNDPFNRGYNIIRHFCKFFLDYSEKSPLIGTLAFAAYAYGGAAVLTPHTLAALLTKLHLSFLAKGIAPTQALGKIIANGASSEAIAAGFTYWQAVILAGDIDDFLAQAVKLINEDPVQLAVVTALAIALGYVMCKAVPPLQEEVGSFPYYSYGALGAKGGLLIYDAVMYPGDDVVTGTLKWFIGIPAFIGQCLISPLVEWSRYGFSEGFVYGCKKSLIASKEKLTHALAGSMHLLLSIAALPFSELASFCLHIPFRGLSKLLTKTLASLGDLKGIGSQLLLFASRKRSWHYFNTFRPSPLYGFNNPLKQYFENPIANMAANVAMCIIVPVKDVVKNVLVLPLLDTSSLLVRTALTTVINPISRSIAGILGGLTYAVGTLSDPSIGRISRWSAGTIGRGLDSFDRQCGKFKRWALSALSKTKSKLRRWAYGNEAQGEGEGRTDYYLSHPLELNKACNSTALIKALLPKREHNLERDEQLSLDSDQSHSNTIEVAAGNDEQYNEGQYDNKKITDDVIYTHRM